MELVSGGGDEAVELVCDGGGGGDGEFVAGGEVGTVEGEVGTGGEVSRAGEDIAGFRGNFFRC